MKKFKPTPKQLVIINRYWKKLCKATSEYQSKAFKLEQELEQKSGIEGIEFFHNYDGYVGVGTINRQMKLLQPEMITGKLK